MKPKGYSPNRGEPLIVSLPGGLSNREDNNGRAPRAKQLRYHEGNSGAEKQQCEQCLPKNENGIMHPNKRECIHAYTHDIHAHRSNHLPGHRGNLLVLPWLPDPIDQASGVTAVQSAWLLVTW